METQGNFWSWWKFPSEKEKSYIPVGFLHLEAYRSEGHHCLAFSAFIVDARKSPKDRFAAFNHYVKEKGHDPNNTKQLYRLTR